MRSSMAAGFPLFAVQLFHNLGVQWANTLLGCIATILILAPVLLYFYGDKIRAKSRFVMNHN
jgi:DHA1 family multidrug resistance protein-like MFS transporter